MYCRTLDESYGITGVVRGKQVITTNPDASQPCPDDKVNREFKAQSPNQLWVSEFNLRVHMAGHGLRRICCRRLLSKDRRLAVSTSMTTAFVLDALNQAICQRSPEKGGGVDTSFRPRVSISIH